jgi:putative tryptophan/tyrosine transport system substrate-binding protein
VIDRRGFVQGMVLAALAGPLAAQVQPAHAHRVPRIGVLGEVDPIGWTVRTSAVEVECRWAEGRRDRLRDLAAELVALGVDVIVAAGTSSARAATSVTAATPIVFVAGMDPARDGSIAGLAGRRDNVTGLLVPSEAEIASECLPLLGQVVSDLDHVAVLSNPDNPLARGALVHAKGAASKQGVELRCVEARTIADAERAFIGVKATGRVGLLVLPDALFAIEQRRIVALATLHRMPALYSSRSFVEAGGLMALSGNAAEVIRRTAAVVARVLAGAPPAALPVEALAPLVLTVNAEAARALGLAMPRSLLARAETIIRA